MKEAINDTPNPTENQRPTFQLDERTFVYFKSGGWRLKMLTNHGCQWLNMGTHAQADIELAMQSPDVQKRIVEAVADAITATGIEKMMDRQITWSDAVREWAIHLDRAEGMQPLTVTTYKSHLMCFARYHGLLNRSVNAVEDEHVIEAVNSLALNLRFGTRYERLKVLKRFLDWSAAKGYTMGNCARVLRHVNSRALPVSAKEPRYKKPWTEEQIAVIIAYLDNAMARYETRLAKMKLGEPGTAGIVANTELQRIRDMWRVPFAWKCAVILARYAGLRMGDCLCLEWDSILPNEYTDNGKNLLVYTHKKDRRLSIPMPDAIRALIPKMLEQKSHDQYAFPIMRARYLRGRTNCTTDFLRMKRLSGLPPWCNFHSLRVTYAFRCREAGMPTENISRLLTHLDAETTALYLGGPHYQYRPN